MIAAVIPAYNEESYIGQVVRSARQYVDVVIVVDNNSTDLTATVAESAGAWVLREYKQGAGAATWRGWCVAKAMECEGIITLDGDGQHETGDIPLMISWIKNSLADVVLGTRFLTANAIPPYRRFGIKVITFFCNLFAADPVSDAQCGIRAFSRKAMQSIRLEESGYGLMIEEIIKARHFKLKVLNIPVTCYYRGLDKDSNMNPIRQGLYTLFYILKWRLKLHE